MRSSGSSSPRAFGVAGRGVPRVSCRCRVRGPHPTAAVSIAGQATMDPWRGGCRCRSAGIGYSWAHPRSAAFRRRPDISASMKIGNTGDGLGDVAYRWVS